MKVLVVEDDATTRRILNRLMSSSFGAEVAEATNGMEALVHLEQDTPDLIVTDVAMPVMDGHALLQAIRSSPLHSDIPVVAVSATKERVEVARLIELGISEYLLKPLDLAAASKRLARVVADIRSKPKSARRRDPSGAGRPRLLLVEPDPNFRELFKGMLASTFEVIDAPSGPKGLSLASEQVPSLVCLSEGLGLLNERLLAGHLRQLATPPDAVYLLHADDRPKTTDGFDGFLRKSFVPEVLAERWAALTIGNDLGKAMEDAIAALGGEVVTATMQTFGVMTQQEVDRLPDDDAEVSAEVGMAVRFLAPEGKLGLVVAIHGAKADGEKLAGAILGETMGWDEGGNEAFGALVETLAGRVRSSFDARSIKLAQEPVEAMQSGAIADPGFKAGFKTPTGERFGVVVSRPIPIG